MVDLDKYNAGSKICNDVLEQLLLQITETGILSVLELSNLGNNSIRNLLQTVYKNSKNKMIGFPVSISLGNCVGNYIYEDSNNQYNIIKHDDIVKIKLGVSIDGCISLLERTYHFDKENSTLSPVLDNLFRSCERICERHMSSGNTNDEVRKLLEIELLENGYKSIENVISYQTRDDHLNTSESKYMILNFQKYYDDSGLIISNDCFEFLCDEVYHINLKFIKTESSVECKSRGNSHIYRFNEYFYNLKSKSAIEFYHKIKNISGTNAFVKADYNSIASNKLGFRECYENGIIDEYPIEYTVDNSDVYALQFTILISKKRGIITK